MLCQYGGRRTLFKCFSTPFRPAEVRVKSAWRAISTVGNDNPTAYCRDLLRKHDYESFLISQFWPKESLQDGYLALRSLSVELAMIGDTVSNPVIGQMRMQFWRDAVKGVYENNPPRHPIALALSNVCRQHKIQRYHLNRLIDARDAELHTPEHLTSESLTDHAEATSSTLLYALLSLLTIPSNSLDSLSHAASHVGVAQGIVTLLRGLPYHASKGRMTIPAEITSKHGVSQEEVFRRGKEANGIVDAVYEFAVLANDHLITARDMLSELDDGKVPREAMPVFLTGVPQALFLERLENADFNAFEPQLQHSTFLLDRHHRPARRAFLPRSINPGSSPLPVVPEAFVGAMDRLCDEILQLVFYELNDPTPLTLVSKRFHNFSQDNFIRAHYFLARYGETQALFYALGRGRILNERVLDTLLASGAHMSRYLVQLAIHHYFRSQGHFIKTTWVRSVPLPVFVHFMKLATEKYGEIPVGKNEDDGSIFATFLRESRFHPSVRTTNWEAIKDILEKYKFLPFTNKDPIMAQFPLALAIEPRLLPLAVANGFQMDSKYRDFVFRKMFERPIASSDTRADDIVRNARELCRLDPTMFLSRTVAAEVCMEAKTNEAAYLALQRLDKAGELRFDLSTLVEELIKLFATTRSIALNSVALTLRQLYADFPSEDYIARHVLLCSIFIQEGFNCSHAHASYPFTANAPHLSTTENLKLRFDELGLGKGPTRLELMAVLLNPFVERFTPVMEWIRWDGRRIVRTEDVEDTSIGSSSASDSSVPRSKDRATKRESDNLPERSGAVGLGLDTVGAKDLIQEVVEKMLEVACKGKMIKRMFERYDYVRETIAKVVLEKHQIDVDDLPPWDDEDACRRYHAKLSRDYTMLDSSTGRESLQLVQQMQPSLPPEVKPDDEGEGCEGHGMGNTQSEPELGHIGQDTLSVMIRQDETAPSRSRRRAFYMYNYANDSANKLPYPNDPLSVGRWVKTQFGTQSRITAVFLTHAIINDNAPDINYFFGYVDAHVPRPEARAVPLTFKHFQLLARLGRAPNWTLYNELERGAEFYYSEDDYLSDTVVIPLKQGSTLTYKIKKEASKTILTQHDPTSASRGTKRPRREAASTTRSYVVPDSDDEAIIGESDDEWMDDDLLMKNMQQQCQKKAETNLQKWIVHLTALCKDEERKYKGKKRSLDKAGKIEARARIQKNDFLRSLSAQLRHLRKVDHDRRLSLYGPEYADVVYSDEDDEEYIDKTTVRHQRRKISRD